MPYVLQEFYRPEWDKEFPAAWKRRLREISPVTDRLAHLRERFFPEQEWWNQRQEAAVGGGMWTLYSCTPRAQIAPDRAKQFEKHWSELPAGEQMGRRVYVSDYQHYMWYAHGVEARPFWILQGDHGGTPAQYTPLETRILDADGEDAQPLPLGVFPSAPFDERAVRALLERDRFYQAGKNIEALKKMDRPDVLKAEDEAAEKAFRKRFLENWRETVKPQAEFLQWFLRKSEADMALPAAPVGLNDAIAQWREGFVEYGTVPNARVASSRNLQMAVI